MKGLIQEVCNEVCDMLLKKNESYGNSAAEPLRIFSRASTLEQIHVRIDDKLSRIMRGSEYGNDDTELDLIGYLILKRCIIKKIKHNEKIENIFIRIQNQINRGVNIATNINKFAHSMDQQISEFDINQLIEQVVFFMGRFLSQKKIDLIFEPMKNPVILKINQIKLFIIISESIDFFLKKQIEINKIILHPEKKGSSIVIAIRACSEYAFSDDDLDISNNNELKKRLEDLNIKTQAFKEPGKYGIDLIISFISDQ